MILKGKDFEIRPLMACKLDSAVQVYRQSAEDGIADGWISGQRVLMDMSNSRQTGGLFCGIFDDQDELVGLIDIVPANFAGQPENACIRMLKIAAPHRYRGFGGKAIDLVEAELRKDPAVTALYACFREDCPTWLGFAARHGFRPATQEERPALSLLLPVTMVKQLS
ncbi:MAG: hypothetical protein IT308_09095 [Anaerolineaceae bacterium]|nr:hypothetical protein [Anaerolineaceae bacterium]